MQSKFLKPSSPLLRKIATEILVKNIPSEKIQTVIKKMLNIAKGERGNPNKPIMVGLAAPQIGISKRIILVDLKADGKGKIGDLKVFINPKVTWVSKNKKEWYEGCYSIPEICGIVSRPTAIKVRAYISKTLGVRSLLPPRWDIVEKKYTGYVARIFLHEIDHLNGQFFIDLIENHQNIHSVSPEEFPLYRNRKAWKNWSKKYPLPIALTKLKKV